MSTTINIFPNTNIVVNGDVPYTFTSNDTGHLNHVEVKPKVSSESINVNLSGISFESVAIEDGTDLGEHTLQWITTSMSNQTWSTVQNRTLTCDDSIKDTYMTELRFLVSKGYNISGVNIYEIYYDAARWIDKTDTNSLSTDGRIETQTTDYFYKYRLRRIDGQAIDSTLLANLGVYVVDDGNSYQEVTTSQFIHGQVFNTGYSDMVVAVYLKESVSTEGVVNLSINWYSFFEDQEIYSNITGFLKVQVRDIRDDSVVAGYDVPIDTARQNVIDTLTLAGPTSITSTTPAVYTLSKTWVNNNSHKYEDLQIYCSAPTSKVSVSWVVPGESFQLEVPQDYTNHNVSLYVQDRYQDYRVWPGCKSNTLTIDVDTSSHVLQSLEIRDLASTIYTGTNSYQFKIYFSPSDADINSLIGNVVGVTPSDYSDMQYYIGTTKHTDSYGSYVDASISYTDLTKEGQLQVYVFDPNTGNRDDVYIVSEAPMPSPLTSLSIENVPIIETDPGTQRYSFRIYIDPQNGDLSNLVWDSWYTVMFRSSRSSFDTAVQFDGTRYYINAWIEFENLSSTGQIGLVIKDSFNPSVYSEYVVTVIQ